MKIKRKKASSSEQAPLPREFRAEDIVQIPVGGTGKPSPDSPLYNKWKEQNGGA